MPLLNSASEIATWRQALHIRPELMLDVHETAGFVGDKLQAFGCERPAEMVLKSQASARIFLDEHRFHLSHLRRLLRMQGFHEFDGEGSRRRAWRGHDTAVGDGTRHVAIVLLPRIAGHTLGDPVAAIARMR